MTPNEETRYPGDLPEPDQAEAKTAFRVAEKVREGVIRDLAERMK
jgi:hypothetical protein